MISMSTGDLSIQGSQAHYELRLPLYEVTHIRNPETSIFQHIRFWSDGREGRLLAHTCRADQAAGAYTCAADYGFPAPVRELEVECTFAEITVPNHVHMLRAQEDGKQDQALFDLSFTRSTLTFHSPGPVAVAAGELAAGFGRALGGVVQILFLAALVLAARSRRELLALTAMFLTGQAAAAVVVPGLGWQPAARFVEAAAALTLAYLAVEILLLPRGGARWLILGVLGIFHGLYFALFLENSKYHAGYVLAGAAAAEALVIALFAVLFVRIAKWSAALRPLRWSASGLLAFGMLWFFLRLRG